MSDYISREECIKDLREYEKTAFSGLTVIGCMSRIKRIPAADAVEVVRCKDCKYWCSTLTYIDLLEARHDPYTDGVCDLYDCDGFQPNGFCSKAVRRDNCGADMREPNLDATKGERRDESIG